MSWILIRRAPARLHRISNARLMFLGSIGRPFPVRERHDVFSPQMHVSGQSAVRALSWFRMAMSTADTAIGGSGSVWVLPSF